MLPKTVTNAPKRSKLVWKNNKSRKFSAELVFHVNVWLKCKWQKNKGKGGGKWHLQSRTWLIINSHMKFYEYLWLFLLLVGKWSQTSYNKSGAEAGLHSETKNVTMWQTAPRSKVKATGTSHWMWHKFSPKRFGYSYTQPRTEPSYFKGNVERRKKKRKYILKSGPTFSKSDFVTAVESWKMPGKCQKYKGGFE